MFKRLLVLTIFIALNTVEAQTSCQNLGAATVMLDPSCSQGGAGCNAGGQGQNCRFCGFDIFPPCTAASTASTGTTASTTPRTTTPRTTTERTTREPYTGPSTTRAPQPEVEYEYNKHGERLIFSDEFETFDFSKWKHDLTMSGGGNWEFQLYHNNRTNSYVKDGVLYIKPTLTEDRIGQDNLRSNYRMDMWGGSPVDQCTGNNFYGCERLAGAGGNILNPIQSAKITTVNSFSVKYGRVEVVAKLPKGDWLWPAIWMLPAKNEYGMWPASGEIDIMESRGNENYPYSAEGGVDSYGSTLHWGVDWTKNRFELTHEVYHHKTSLSEEFHTYGLYWDEKRLYTYFDDEDNIVLDVDLTEKAFFDRGQFTSNYENPWDTSDNMHAPFDKEFYLIINLAVGGTAGFFPDGVANKPWSDKSSNSVNEFYAAKNNWYKTWQNPQVTFEIDSVKVWALPEDK